MISPISDLMHLPPPLPWQGLPLALLGRSSKTCHIHPWEYVYLPKKKAKEEPIFPPSVTTHEFCNAPVKPAQELSFPRWEPDGWHSCGSAGTCNAENSSMVLREQNLAQMPFRLTHWNQWKAKSLLWRQRKHQNPLSGFSNGIYPVSTPNLSLRHLIHMFYRKLTSLQLLWEAKNRNMHLVK